jgi:hypothetical protein
VVPSHSSHYCFRYKDCGPTGQVRLRSHSETILQEFIRPRTILYTSFPVHYKLIIRPLTLWSLSCWQHH